MRLCSLSLSILCLFAHLCPTETEGSLLLLDQYGSQTFARRTFLLSPLPPKDFSGFHFYFALSLPA
jgi:hypothetical protein